MSHVPAAPADALSGIARQIVWNRLIAVVEEQAMTLLRTAFSPIVRECGDLSAGVFDTQGHMLAQAVTGTPGHINSMARSVGHFMRHFPLETMRPGDVYICNDPWMGTGHLNDFVLVTPTFLDGECVATFACTSHLVDIGGLGMAPDGQDVYAEGLYIPMLKVIDEGRVNETVMAFVRANSRSPVEAEGDVYSLIACNQVGCDRLVDLMREFNLTSLDEVAADILGSSEDAVRAAIRELPQGSWSNTMRIDGLEAPVDLTATLTIGDGGVVVDYAGTSGPSRFGINVPMTYCEAYTVFGLACAIAPRIPNNHGSLAPYVVTAPEDCILNAQKPAPVVARHVIGQMLPDVVFGCLHQVIPGRVPAEGTSCLWNVTMGGKGGPFGRFTINSVHNGGTGARPAKDGLSATAYPSGVRGTPVEITESTSPLRFRRKEYRIDSGGAGATRGGLGQSMEIESRVGEEFTLYAAYDRIDHPPRGRAGGKPGIAARVALDDGRLLKAKGRQEIPKGTALMAETSGGGGYGDPFERPAERVLADVLDGLVSRDAARDLYGVVVTGDGIDEAATAARRSGASSSIVAGA